MTDVKQDRLDAATMVGAFIDDAFVAGEDNGVEAVRSRTAGVGADRVSVAAPSKQAQQAAPRWRPSGRRSYRQGC